MSDPLGLSVGTTNLVAARVGNQPVTRRSVLTLAQSGAPITGFVERVGDRVPLVVPDGTSYLAEQLLVEALDVMVQVGGGPSDDVAIAESLARQRVTLENDHPDAANLSL